MGQDRSRNEGREAESLEDLVYRPTLGSEHRRLRSASPLVAVPLAVLGYLLLAFLGWRLVRMRRAAAPEPLPQVIIDLDDPSAPETPRPVEPPRTPEAPRPGGAPPPGAILKPGVPPPTLPPSPETAPDKPPTALPQQDHSGVAFPAGPGSGTSNGNGTGTSTGPGSGSGSGEGQGIAVIRRESKPPRLIFEPPTPYPPQARAIGLQGKVKVEVQVGKDGVPLSAKAVEGPALLRSAAEAMAMKTRWTPATENGEPVASIAVIPVTFSINSN